MRTMGAFGFVLLAASAVRAAAPYPPSPVIADVVLDWTTHRRHAVGSDNWQLTWADDDHQYGAWGDGGGFGGTNSDGRVGLGFARIEGDGHDYRGSNVWGGKNAENPAQFAGKSWGTICVGGVLYSWIVPDEPDTGGPRDHFRYIELARSTDRGAHWTRADWRWWREDDLTIPTFLVYGKNNAGARDDYVYSYFIRPRDVAVTQSAFGLNVHKPGALFLARVRNDRIFAGRASYEWFTGMVGADPTWGPLSKKTPVFENPEGTGWCASASYNPGLRRYLLATEHTVSHASVMALFDAPEPWGPWTTVKCWTTSHRFGDHRPGSTLDWADNVFFFSFAPKWLSADGRTFTLVFTGGGRGKNNDSLNTVRGAFQLHGRAPKAAHEAFPRGNEQTSRSTPHRSGPGWPARSFPYDSFIRNSPPALTGASPGTFSALVPTFHSARTALDCTTHLAPIAEPLRCRCCRRRIDCRWPAEMVLDQESYGILP